MRILSVASFTLASTLGLTTALGAQAGSSIARRIAAAPDGEVRLTYATRSNVCGDGRDGVSIGRSMYFATNIESYGGWSNMRCERGPARVTLTVEGHQVVGVRTRVAGTWSAGSRDVTDLGAVPAAEAAAYFLSIVPALDGVTRARQPDARRGGRRQRERGAGHAAHRAHDVALARDAPARRALVGGAWRRVDGGAARRARAIERRKRGFDGRHGSGQRARGRGDGGAVDDPERRGGPRADGARARRIGVGRGRRRCSGSASATTRNRAPWCAASRRTSARRSPSGSRPSSRSARASRRRRTKRSSSRCSIGSTARSSRTRCCSRCRSAHREMVRLAARQGAR